MTTLADVLRTLEEMEERQRQADEDEANAIANSGPWPRWRCRFGWHRPVAVRSGEVTGLGFVTRLHCAGGCGAWWLDDILGRQRQR